MRPLRKSGVPAECFEVLKAQMCSSLKNGQWKCGFNLLRAYQMDVASNANGQSAIAPHPKRLQCMCCANKSDSIAASPMSTQTPVKGCSRFDGHGGLCWYISPDLRFSRWWRFSGNFRVSKGIYSSWAVLGSYRSIHFLASSSNPNQRPATCPLLRPPSQHLCMQSGNLHSDVLARVRDQLVLLLPLYPEFLQNS